MPAGDYYLNKFNGSTIDEKIFVAQANKVLGFDNQLNPIMISAAYVTFLNADYIPKYNGSSFTNSCMRQAGMGIGINLSINAEATLHVDALPGDAIAKFSTTPDQSSIIHASMRFQYDYYGGEMAIIGQMPNYERNLLCLFDDGAIGIGYGALKVYEDAGTVGIGLVSGQTPNAPLHIKTGSTTMAIFETNAMTTTGDSFLFAVDYYGGELGLIGNYLGVNRDLICILTNGTIGLGYNALVIWETEASVTLQVYTAPLAQFQINEAGCNTDRTPLLVYVGDTLTVPRPAIGLQVKNAYDLDLFNVVATQNHSMTTVGNITSGTHSLIVNGIVTATGGSSTNWNAAYAHSQVSHAYVPYTGATSSVNLGVNTLITPTLQGGIVQASSLTFVPTNYMTTLASGIAYSFKGGNYGTTVLLSANHYGCFGFGIAPSTTAVMTLKAGINTLAPLRLTSGVNLTTATAGSIEYDGTNLYFTPGTTRYTVSLSNHTHSYEPVLGNPAGNGYILSSTTLGVRSWIAAPATHNAVTIGTANGLSLSVQALSMAAASTSVTSALTSTDWNTFNNKVSFPGFGVTGSTAAYGNHTHSNYDNYNQWTFQPETALGAGASYTISSGYYLQLKAGTGMDLSHSITGSTVTVTLTSSGGFPGFGTTHTTAAYGDHTHSNYDNYNQWTFQAFNGAYDEYTLSSGNVLRFNTGANIEFDTADLAVDGILVISVKNIPDIVLTGYTYGSIGLIAATDSLKVGLSKLQTQMPKTLYYDISDFVNVGSGVNDITPYTLPANTLAYDGQRLELLYSGISAANTNGKTIQFYFGGTSYITITNSSATSLNWFLRITLIRYSSTYFKLRFDGGWNVVGYGTGFGMSINYAANNIIKLTAQGGATNDITCKLVTITQISI